MRISINWDIQAIVKCNKLLQVYWYSKFCLINKKSYKNRQTGHFDTEDRRKPVKLSWLLKNILSYALVSLILPSIINNEYSDNKVS